MSNRGHEAQNQLQPNAFAAQAAARQTGFVSELLGFLRHNKKWWLAPILIVLLLVSFLAVLAGTSVAPLIYTLF